MKFDYAPSLLPIIRSSALACLLLLCGGPAGLAQSPPTAATGKASPALSEEAAPVVDVSDPEVQRDFSADLGPGATGSFLAQNGMVATSSVHATLAALETLRAGGNAFDAAVVAQMVLAVSEPYASGIGGGLFAVGHVAESGEVFTLDGREESPIAFGPERFLDGDGNVVAFRDRATGGDAAGVPGTVAACAMLLETRGTLSLAEAVAPAVRLAREGFRLNHNFSSNTASHWDRISQFPESAKIFGHPDGTPLGEGDLFRNPDLADTLELFGTVGAAAFYSGEIAEDIVFTIRESLHRPGVMTLDDLANYRAVERRPVSLDYRGYRIYGMGPPSSGGLTLGLMLNLLEANGYHDFPAYHPDSVHRLIDAQNLAFADRNQYLADADFADIPAAGFLDKDYARSRAELLSAEHALPVPASPGDPGGPFLHESTGESAALPPASTREESESTTHFTVVDRDRNLVSITSTIEQHFGSGLVVKGRGFLLNNQLTDFEPEALDAEGETIANAPETGRKPRRTALGETASLKGGKRPRSSMTPTLVMDGDEPRLILGSPGGSRIIGVTLNVLLNIIDHEMEPQAAVNAPRVVARNGKAELESVLHDDAALREELEKRGFELVKTAPYGSVQAILIDAEGRLHGAADPRREGIALGY